MFAGIVEGTAAVTNTRSQAGGVRLMVDLQGLSEGVSLGDSIAVDGVCLTAAGLSGTTAEFDVITETLSKTTLGRLQKKSRVNIERSLKVGDRIAGHFVQGHVDAVGTLVEKNVTEQEYQLWFSAPSLMQYIAPRGSVAINGVSLTIAAVTQDRFAVALIPTTLEITNLGQLNVDDHVNIEADIISKQIVRWLEAQAGNLGVSAKKQAVQHWRPQLELHRVH